MPFDVMGLLALHFALVLALWFCGKKGLLPNHVEYTGYAYFASDSLACHVQALELWDYLKEGDYDLWWWVTSRFHTRAASICYLLFGPYVGHNVLAVWPMNALCLGLSCWAWKSLIVKLGGQGRYKVWIWFCFPILIIHFTQLLRDPFYITFFLLWINAWVKLYNENHYKSCLAILLISSFLFWTRERFWVLAQVMSLAWLCYALVLCLFKKRSLGFLGLVLGVVLCLNSYSLYKQVNRWMGHKVESGVVYESVSREKFHFLYKVATLRHSFNKSYSQKSSLDNDIEFASDRDVITYIPRALQIGLFTPFPNMWLEEGGKTGRAGRWVSAFESMIIWLAMAWGVWWWLRKPKQPGDVIILSALVLTCLALGLVVTNGGAVYRMRLSSWLILGAFVIGVSSRPFFQNQGVKLEVLDKKVGEGSL